MTAHTDFSQYSHQQLVAMLYAGDPQTARAAGSVWDSTGGSLHDRANDLTKHLHSFQDKWEGGAAEQYHTMISDLAAGIRKVADTAFDLRDLTLSSAESLEDARAKMPQPVNVPDLSPTTVQVATTPLSSDTSLPAQTQQTLAARQSDAIRAVTEHQQAARAADAAHQQAVQVMTTLAGHYTAAEQSMPVPPDAAPQPGTPVDDTGTAGPTTLPALNPMTLQPVADQTGVTGTDPSILPVVVGGGAIAGAAASPLFGRMFTAGLAAAAGATAGRFGGVLPKVPPFMNRDKKPGASGPVGDPALRTGNGAGTGTGGIGAGGGGGGADVGGIGGGTGGPGDGPVAHTAMTGSGASPVAGVGVGAGAAAAGAASTKGMGMMPMMPMGAGMMGGDMGAGRRIPPWLVETENVWGETAPVAPSVIGEEPDASTGLPGSGWA